MLAHFMRMSKACGLAWGLLERGPLAGKAGRRFVGGGGEEYPAQMSTKSLKTGCFLAYNPKD
jgi:hypothetical protein